MGNLPNIPHCGLLCSYPQASCDEEQMDEILHAHNCALQRPDDYWQIVPSTKASRAD